MSRPSEVKAITALLEAEHPDVESLAKVVIDELDQLRLSRPSYVIRLAWDDGDRFAVGPFENRQQARSHLRTIVPGIAREEQDRYIAEVKPRGWWTGDVATPAKGSCPECGHPTHCHDWPKYRKKQRGCVVFTNPRNPTDHCPCEGDGT